jgi:hypothetical protein
MTKAAETLVYSNNEMEIEEKARDEYSSLPKGIELPKNTLMAFRHVLTTSTKDRDGDILRSEGMEPDPKMLLLWQHVHTLPIGKMLGIADQNEKHLKLFSAIVDVNELCHDTAVMIDNDMGRFSHGFRALEFEEIKSKEKNKPNGFDIKRGEIMEESFVSVAANPDADNEEIILSLVEGGKLTSPLMKEWGKGIRENRPIQVQGTSIEYTQKLGDVSETTKVTCSSLEDLKKVSDMGLIGGTKDEDKSGSGSDKTEGTGGEKGAADTSEETHEESEGEDEEKTTDKEVKCPKCESTNIEDGCKNCGLELTKTLMKVVDLLGEKIRACNTDAPWDFVVYRNGKFATHCWGKNFEKAAEWVEKITGEKRGRILSTKNEKRIRKSMGIVGEVVDMDDVVRPAKFMLQAANRELDGVLGSLGSEERETQDITVKEAMAVVLSQATPDERKQLKQHLTTFEKLEESEKRTEAYTHLVGG